MLYRNWKNLPIFILIIYIINYYFTIKLTKGILYEIERKRTMSN